MNVAERVGRRLRAARDGRGLTRKQVCDRLGINQASLYRYESGTSEPALEIINTLCELYGVSLASVVDLENAKPAI